MSRELEHTSYVMSVVYDVENLLRSTTRTWSSRTVADWINNDEYDSKDNGYGKQVLPRPHDLVMLYARHDPTYGMTGVAFKNTATGEIIVGYAGTNNETNLGTDWTTNIQEVGAGQGRHYQSAIDFYQEVSNRYGAPAVVTGHSQGGAYAQRVGIRFNTANIVTYNASPMYLSALATALADTFLEVIGLVPKFLTESEIAGLPSDWREFAIKLNTRPDLREAAANYFRMIQSIDEDLRRFSGRYTHFRSKFDVLNNIGAATGGGYVPGKEVILDDGGWHLHDVFTEIERSQEIINMTLNPATRNLIPSNDNHLLLPLQGFHYVMGNFVLPFISNFKREVIPATFIYNTWIRRALTNEGTEGNDRQIGEYASDTIDGRAGDDFIDGKDGDDQLFGSEGNDKL